MAGNETASVAAVDLGSNSFHLIIARVLGDQVAVLDRLRETVRLAADLDEAGTLSGEALERMLTTLKRFRQRLVDLPQNRVRAVGTDTFRRVKKPEDLLARASAALGVPIEVLPGGEEARLIYLGVTHEEPAIEGRRLVIDVGGGSTECILGKRLTPLLKDSLAMGCVNFMQRFFPEGRFTRKAFRKAEIAAALEFEPLQRRYCDAGWEDCVGTSGTVNALSDLVRQSGRSDGALTLDEIKRVQREFIAAEELERLSLPGLAPDRAQVLAGGLAILGAAFESLEIESMRPSKAALREGVLYDLLGRFRHEDARDRTIRVLSERYHVDEDQAERVERTALKSLAQVSGEWKLDQESSTRLLSWAAHMHEIGLALSHSGYHKHGSYILENSDMPGFSNQDQRQLAALVKGHRRRLTRATFAEWAPGVAETLLKLCVLLRIAVRLHRTRSPRRLPGLRVKPAADGLELRFPAAWLEKHPLTSADLEQEDRLLAECGVRLRVVTE